MAEFEAAIEAQLSGGVVRASPLVHFDFRSGAVRVWPGFGPLDAGGYRWQGIGNLGSMSPVTAGSGGAIEEISFSLFGDETMLATIEEDAEEASGREVNVWLQFFDIRQEDEAGNWVEWQPLSDPLVLFWGRMGPLAVQRTPPGEDARASRIVSVSAQNAFLNRSRPAFAWFTDRDQKSRAASDNMFVRVSQLTEGTVRWPQF